MASITVNVTLDEAAPMMASTPSEIRRVEVTVPSEDAVLVREIAAALRAGGESAERVRDSVEPLLKRKRATTGRELVDFFLNSPLAGSGIEVERDKSPGRDIDL